MAVITIHERITIQFRLELRKPMNMKQLAYALVLNEINIWRRI